MNLREDWGPGRNGICHREHTRVHLCWPIFKSRLGKTAERFKIKYWLVSLPPPQTPNNVALFPRLPPPLPPTRHNIMRFSTPLSISHHNTQRERRVTIPLLSLRLLWLRWCNGDVSHRISRRWEKFHDNNPWSLRCEIKKYIWNGSERWAPCS